MSSGFRLFPGYLDPAAQQALAAEIAALLREAPLYQARMPKTGKPLSVLMSNAGPLGWYSDAQGGYRYVTSHPETGRPWPAIPASLRQAWGDLAGDYRAEPECCLINLYRGQARMGLHQDRDEADFTAPVVSLSLGDTGLFRLGGATRQAATRSFRLASGDAMVLAGPDRLAFHGIDRIQPGSSRLLDGIFEGGGRLNLTLRRVTKP
ncbi:alpha-ketoglutarate-dependent dioxygenase AlkB [Ferrovibrio sp.]|uniref:alpha-ketoglutarate-dependent dioxygenase AlkB family protein n=1 Tax=Ferrovibrio sp. TaxID=1917215 RepID=UPI0035B0200C